LVVETSRVRLKGVSPQRREEGRKDTKEGEGEKKR
jgi:hypothetical protein